MVHGHLFKIGHSFFHPFVLSGFLFVSGSAPQWSELDRSEGLGIYLEFFALFVGIGKVMRFDWFCLCSASLFTQCKFQTSEANDGPK
jgi:hypothetical protein